MRRKLFNIADKFRTSHLVAEVASAIDKVAEFGNDKEVQQLVDALQSIEWAE